ncbi:AAA family ATPase [Niabella yanshanensis]|uniref:AAA family ATPase n=1 Tax=Niabella yanshanensis TaxID=577386 RepID=A0ABZ0WDJ4_9BACT|nr:AAA family ATPase [Niabella yanshanensis]WQD40761.1 AAA family ATPase [Niabella yanshanensis]
MQQHNYFVITGGPGVGKTTLLTELGKRGFTIIPEDARRIIQEQVAIDGDGLPWENKELYAQLMLEESRQSYRKAATSVSSVQAVFFDRGIVDAVCYMMMEDMPVTRKANKWVKLCSYNRRVFILPPWREIYQTDKERKQTWAEAVRTYEAMKEVYIGYGYDVIGVPKGTVTSRTDFILEQIRKL